MRSSPVAPVQPVPAGGGFDRIVSGTSDAEMLATRPMARKPKGDPTTPADVSSGIGDRRRRGCAGSRAPRQCAPGGAHAPAGEAKHGNSRMTINSELLDRLSIRELIDNWAMWRDTGRWDDFRTVWHPDGDLMARSFQGDVAACITGSRER